MQNLNEMGITLSFTFIKNKAQKSDLDHKFLTNLLPRPQKKKIKWYTYKFMENGINKIM